MANMAGLNRTIEDTDTDPMADESVELTEGQKACLRLVDDHMTSKEIGRSLGISHFTVDQRLDAARRARQCPTHGIGPNIRANVSAGSALFQLDASWRVRVAGHAQPGNGPAVTLSTSF